MEIPDAQTADAVARLPAPADGDRAAAESPRRLSRRARRRERRREAKRERYGPLDFAEDVLDLTLDVMFFWR